MADFLIVGGGLAGCHLAYQLMMAEQSVLMIDAGDLHAASDIGAGIYNPLLPKHHKIAYQAEHIYPGLEDYYHEFEEWLGQKVLSAQPIHYILPSSAEQNDWSALAYNSHLSYWVEVNTGKINPNFRTPHGYLKIKHSGWVDAKKLTGCFRDKLMSQNALLKEAFDFNALKIEEDGIQYKSHKARHIIFCEGNHIENNPLNKSIQLKPAKGELLVIKTDFDVDFIAQQGVFMLPLGDGLYKVGSNFTWDPLDHLPTEAGKADILSRLSLIFKGEFEIVDHYAGVRPSSMDRRPIVGQLKPYGNVHVLNGLGSKGVALAPYYSRMLVKNLLHGELIEREVNAERYQ